MSRNVRSSSGDRIFPVLFFAAAWLCLFFVFPYHLVYKEQISLFVADPAFIGPLFAKPAALAVIIGDFLTQFFLIRWAAVTITVLACILLWDALRRFFIKEKIRDAAISALIPTAAELALGCQLEYPLSMTVGAIIAAWSALGCSYIGKTRPGRALECVLPAVLYPLAGIHTLVFIILSSIRERKSPVFCFFLILAGTGIIIAEGCLYHLPAPETLSYPVIHGYMLRGVFLFASFEAAVLLAYIAGTAGLKGWAAFASACILSGAGFALFHDAKQEYDLRISTMAYYGKWDRVRQLGLANRHLSQTGSYYCNLSYAREGKLADGLTRRYQPLFYGLFLPVSGSESYTKVLASADALLECHDYAQAQHSLMLAMNFTPTQKSSRALRKLAEIAVCNGDTLAARRYIDILKKTAIHAGWARDAEALMKEEKGNTLNINKDEIFIVNDFRASLRNIAESDPSATAATDYLLCYDLLQKDIRTFKEDFDRYWMPARAGLIPPRPYQEALEMLEAGPEYTITSKVKADNQAFLSGNELAFKNSYWFYFKYAEPGK